MFKLSIRSSFSNELHFFFNFHCGGELIVDPCWIPRQILDCLCFLVPCCGSSVKAGCLDVFCCNKGTITCVLIQTNICVYACMFVCMYCSLTQCQSDVRISILSCDLLTISLKASFPLRDLFFRFLAL
jgi:hypothetical protein